MPILRISVSPSIFILFSSVTTPKNLTFLTFHLHFSSFTYKSFSASLFITFFTNLSCFSSFSVLIIMLSIKLATLLVLMKSCSILFIMVWNVTGEFVRPKNITVSSNDPSSIMNATFHLSLSFIYTLLYSHLMSIFVNTFLVPIFSTMSNIRGKE